MSVVNRCKIGHIENIVIITITIITKKQNNNSVDTHKQPLTTHKQILDVSVTSQTAHDLLTKYVQIKAACESFSRRKPLLDLV